MPGPVFRETFAKPLPPSADISFIRLNRARRVSGASFGRPTRIGFRGERRA
jgi:hypothetical protein